MGKLDFFDKLMTEANDYHIPFAGGVFFVGTIMAAFHRLDAEYITFTSTILTFIGTHAYIKSKNGGDDSSTAPLTPPDPK